MSDADALQVLDLPDQIILQLVALLFDLLFQLREAGGGLFDLGGVFAFELRLLAFEPRLGLLEDFLELLDLGSALFVAFELGQPHAHRLLVRSRRGLALRLSGLERGLEFGQPGARRPELLIGAGVVFVQGLVQLLLQPVHFHGAHVFVDARHQVLREVEHAVEVARRQVQQQAQPAGGAL